MDDEPTFRRHEGRQTIAVDVGSCLSKAARWNGNSLDFDFWTTEHFLSKPESCLRALLQEPNELVLIGSSYPSFVLSEVFLPSEFAKLTESCAPESVDENVANISASRFYRVADLSADSQSTICHVDVGAGCVLALVFKNGALIDQACLGLGSEFISITEKGVVTEISEYGETFIDGVAKTAPVGQVLPAEKLELFCMLLGEVIAHFLHDKRPPQITQRLLTGEKLRRDQPVDRFILSGGIFSYDADKIDSLYNPGRILRRTIIESLKERQMNYEIGRSPMFAGAAGLLGSQIP